MKKKTLIIFAMSIVLTLAFALAGCTFYEEAEEETSYEGSLSASNIKSEETADEVVGYLNAAGLSNTEDFKAWTLDFAKVVGSEAGLTDEWTHPEEMQADLGKCMDGWEAAYDYSDSDCRITAFLLMEDLITMEKPYNNYDGTYLMFDVEALDTAEKYAKVAEKKNQFCTLFSEGAMESTEKIEEMIPTRWSDFGISINSDKAKLVSLVMYDPDGQQAFIGHTGVLVDLNAIGEGSGYLFVEKLAFEQPYQATKADTVDEIVDMLSSRAEYVGEEPEYGPYIFINDKLEWAQWEN